MEAFSTRLSPTGLFHSRAFYVDISGNNNNNNNSSTVSNNNNKQINSNNNLNKPFLFSPEKKKNALARVFFFSQSHTHSFLGTRNSHDSKIYMTYCVFSSFFLFFFFYLATLTGLLCVIVIRLGSKADCLSLSWSGLVKVSLQGLVRVHSVDLSQNVLESELNVGSV